MRLENKVAVVTGAGSGIGKEIARHFSGEGAKVVIADHNQARADDRRPGTGDRTRHRHCGRRYRRGPGRGLLCQDGRLLGQVDILVSNAGIQSVAPIEQFDFGKWRQLLAVHLDGAFLTTRAALRHMSARGRGGSIIYMGSVHSKEASVLKAPYVTAKHGLIGLAKVVAKEGAKHGVRANVICPGFVRTPLVDRQIPEQARELGISEQDVIRNVMLKETVDGEFTTVEDVAQTALFLASFGSNALTGQSVVVSHGWSMQ